jgi:hypothetical protein
MYVKISYVYKSESIYNSCLCVCCYAALALSLGSGPVTRLRPNNEVMRSFVGSVARQRSIGNNGVVFSLGSALTAGCRGKIFLLIQGYVVNSRHL